MKIIIPTYRRADRQGTVKALSPAFRKLVTLVVRPEEAAETSELNPEVSVEVLPDGITNLLQTRQWIWEKFGNERFVMADDDIRFFKRRTVDWSVSTKGIKTSIIEDDEAQAEMFSALENELDSGAGMAQPGPAWLMPDLQYWPKKSAGNCVQFVMFDGPRLQNLNIRWDRLEWVEDQDVVLQVLSKGLDCVQLQNFIFAVPLLGVGEGGLNTDGIGPEERAIFESHAHAKLAELWPNYVKPSKKKKDKHVMYRARLLRDAKERNSNGT